jgi:pantoate--beta-alanine ligase
MSTPEIVTDPSIWQARCLEVRERGGRIALVPTMGYLHEGHLSLMREARRRIDQPLGGAGRAQGRALASIFVNPAQFGPNEDLSRYPRDLQGDLQKCGTAGIDWVLVPEPGSMYPPDHQTWVEVTGVSQGLCGERRPGHFRGVATVVAKLLTLTHPQVALFGEKDYQQLQVIRALARDLFLGVEIVGMPIVREADGLALSSRNVYLSPKERAAALSLSQALFRARERAASGERSSAVLIAEAAERISLAGARVDYVEIVHPDTLVHRERAEPESVMLVAAYLGRTRLIDNLRLP